MSCQRWTGVRSTETKCADASKREAHQSASDASTDTTGDTRRTGLTHIRQYDDATHNTGQETGGYSGWKAGRQVGVESVPAETESEANGTERVNRPETARQPSNTKIPNCMCPSHPDIAQPNIQIRI